MMLPATVAPSAIGSADAPAVLRVRLYGLCLLVSGGLFALLHGWSAGPVGLAATALFLAGTAWGLAVPTSGAAQRLLPAAAGLAAATVLVFPLGQRVAEGASVPTAVGSTAAVWPQILVLLFAGRLLAELSDLRFAAFWRAPIAATHRPRTQSLPAAAMLGAALTIAFYQFAGGLAVEPQRLDPSAIFWRALTGQTVVHVAILFLFFTLISAILDAALLLAADRAVLGAFRRLCLEWRARGRPLPRAELRQIALRGLEPFAHSRTVRCINEATAPSSADRQSRAPLDAFHAASRRLIRSLLSFLPLLGFLGTVIGLTAAIGSLPASLGPSAAGQLDISGSIAGLAVKFETTLLGLAGGLVASFLLSLLERHEAELQAECARLVEALGDAA